MAQRVGLNKKMACAFGKNIFTLYNVAYIFIVQFLFGFCHTDSNVAEPNEISATLVHRQFNDQGTVLCVLYDFTIPSAHISFYIGFNLKE